MAKIWRDPHEVGDRAGHVLLELREGDDLRRAGAAVVGERVVLQRVWGAARLAGARHAVHIGAPGNAGVGPLRADAAGGEGVPSVVGGSPSASRTARQGAGAAG